MSKGKRKRNKKARRPPLSIGQKNTLKENENKISEGYLVLSSIYFMLNSMIQTDIINMCVAIILNSGPFALYLFWNKDIINQSFRASKLDYFNKFAKSFFMGYKFFIIFIIILMLCLATFRFSILKIILLNSIRLLTFINIFFIFFKKGYKERFIN